MNAHIHGRAGFDPLITPPPFLAQAPLERAAGRHWLVRGLASVIGCLLLMMGACAGVLAYLLVNDDRASGVTPVWMMAACLALVACSYPFLSPSRPIPWTPSGMRVQPIRAQRWRCPMG